MPITGEPGPCSTRKGARERERERGRDWSNRKRDNEAERGRESERAR